MESAGHTAGHLQSVRATRDRERRSLGSVPSSHTSSAPAIGSLTGGLPCTMLRIEEKKTTFLVISLCSQSMCKSRDVVMSLLHPSADLCLWPHYLWGRSEHIGKQTAWLIVCLWPLSSTRQERLLHFLQGALQGIIQRVPVASQDREKEFGMQLGCEYYSASPRHFCLLTMGCLFQINGAFSKLATNGMCDLLQCMHVQVGRW